jgi:broad specificity phosphatase PhoE
MDAQARIAAELDAVLADHDPAVPLLLVGHGGVGTLLYCRHAGLAIDRRFDQPKGGCVFALDAQSLAPRFAWEPMEEVENRLGSC